MAEKLKTLKVFFQGDTFYEPRQILKI